MKSLLYTGNKTFKIKDGEKLELQPGEVRLKVAYCGVCGTDVHIYHGNMDQRVQIPQVIGHEVSAEVDAVGPDVTGWEVGYRVAVRPLKPGQEDPSDNNCNHIGKNLKFIGIDTVGGMQSYWNVPAYTLHRLPENLSLREGAMIEPLAVACHDVRLGEVQAGECVAVIGGGPIGILVALVARQRGARVLVSEVNPTRIALAGSLGLKTVDPREKDLIAEVAAFSDGAMADVVFEVSGTQAGLNVMTQLPKARGRIVMVAIHAQPKPVDLFRFFWRELKLIGARVYEPEDFEEAIALAANGDIPLGALITEVAPLEQGQQIFEAIDKNPAGMKYLLQCM